MMDQDQRRIFGHMADDIAGIRTCLTYKGVDGMGTNINVVDALCRIEDAINRNTKVLQQQAKSTTLIAQAIGTNTETLQLQVKTLIVIADGTGRVPRHLASLQ